MNKGTAVLVYKLIIAAVVAAVVITGGYIAYQEFFSPKPDFRIDDTENVIDKITAIGEFTSVTYYEEQVLKNDKLSSFSQSAFGKYLKPDYLDELIFIAKGHVKAGFDLSAVKEEDIRISADTVSVLLPPAEIFDIIMNPSDFEVYVEEGDWSHEEVQKIQHDAKIALKDNAVAAGVLDKAEKAGVRKLVNLFKTFGFKVVDIEVKEAVDPKALFKGEISEVQ